MMMRSLSRTFLPRPVEAVAGAPSAAGSFNSSIIARSGSALAPSSLCVMPLRRKKVSGVGVGRPARAIQIDDDPVTAGVIHAGVIVHVAVRGIGALQPGYVPDDDAVVLHHLR